MEHGGSHEDVTATLSELERKLKELEQELESVGRSGETASDPAQAGWTPPAESGAPAPGEPGPPPPGATPFAAEWHGGTQPPPQPVFHATVPPPPAPPGAPAPGHGQLHHDPPLPGVGGPVSGFTEPPPPPLGPAPHVIEWRTYATPPPQPSAVPDVQVPAPPPPGAAPEAPGRLDELLRVREELVRTADRLVAELQRVLDDLASTPAAPAPIVLQSGRVAVEAEPFGDLAALSAFEQALSRAAGVTNVYVRSLDNGRALLEAELDRAVDLATELRRTAPVGFEVVEAAEDRLSLRLGAA